MIHYLRYCCAMLFALFSFLLATPLSAQAQTREAYVAQSADKTTLTFYYDALRATRTGTTWGIGETKKEGDIPVPAWAGTSQEVDKTTTRVVFDASFRDFRPTTTAKWFHCCEALKQIEGLEYLNTSEVKDMSKMFHGCSALTTLDLKHFNTKNVTDMSSMFAKCWALTTLDLKNFNTQNVTNMTSMFSLCAALTSLDLKNFNTQNVTDMSGMFDGCSRLKSLDLKNFNTQNVTNMEAMFANCEALISLDLKHFDTQNVTDMRKMFYDCKALTSLDLKNFNTKKVTDMRKMFSGCAALTTINSNTAWQCPESENLLATPLSAQAHTREAYVSQSADKTTLTFYYDALRAARTGTTWGIEETKSVMFDGTFPGWAGTSLEVDTTTTRVVFDASFRDFRPTTTAKWFYDCKALKQIEGMEYLNTSEVKDMSRMFWGCSALTSLDLKHFNTQNVTNMECMFRQCSALTSLDLKSFNTQNVTDMSSMFDGCKALTTLDLQNFNTQNVTDMYGMFWNCAALTSLDLKHFNTQNVIDMRLMFSGCSALTSLNLQNFNTQKVTDMFWMFHGCSALTSLNLQNFNTQKVTDMCQMFYGCSALTSLNLKSFNTQNVTNMRGMFSGCSALTSLDLKNFETQNVTDMSWMFFACPALTTIYSNTAWRCPKSDDMFFCNPKLKGAVSYDGKNTDVMMANPETGYFTAKPTTVERNKRSAAHLPAASKRVRGARKHLPNGVSVVNGKKTVKP